MLPVAVCPYTVCESIISVCVVMGGTDYLAQKYTRKKEMCQSLSCHNIPGQSDEAMGSQARGHDTKGMRSGELLRTFKAFTE